MRTKANFYRIGLFAIIALVICFVFILMMGGRSWFDKSIYIETYFDESVQGLEVGSNVKYRGVKIGKVTNIDFVNDVYNLNGDSPNSQYFSHFVYVLMSVNLNLFSPDDQAHIQEIFNQAIKNGMRVHLSPQGLTGSTYIELDFYDPNKNPPLPIQWTPKYPYIPSRLSTLSQLSDNLNKFIQGLSNANIGQIMQNVDKATAQTSQAMSKVNMILSDQQQNIEASMSNMRIITNNLRTITDNAKNYPPSVLFGAKPPKLDLKNDQQKN